MPTLTDQLDQDRFVYGVIDRPDYEDDYLLDTVGYVQRIWVEQEGERDQIKFILRVYRAPTITRDLSFSIYLDRGATVAFAQLQLLRDAMMATATKQGLLVRVHFNWDNTDMELGHVYSLQLIDQQPYPTTVPDYYGVSGSYTHVD